MKNSFFKFRDGEEKQKKILQERRREKRTALEAFLIQARAAQEAREKQTKFFEQVAEHKACGETALQIQIIQSYR